MLYKFMYGFYPVQNCSLRIVEMQSKTYLSLSTLTGAVLVNEEVEITSVGDFMTELTKFIDSYHDALAIDLDLFLKEYK